MKTYIILALATIFTSVITNAQEFKLAKSTGKLSIREVNHVTIEPTTGNEIIFVREGRDHDEDDRAKGLRAVSASGVEDNTGLGISVIDKGGDIEVRQLKKMDGPEITIKVPKGVIVSVFHTSPHGDDVTFKNFDGQIDVSTVHCDVKLENVSGPVNVKTVHGDVDATLNAGMKNPISITSQHGHVDTAIPAATKATMSLDTQFGEIFIDPDFKLEREKSGEFVKYGDGLSGKLNGGGTVEITLSSAHGNVYLRKTK